MSTKPGSMPASVLPIPMAVQSISKHFSKGLIELAIWLAKYSCTEVCMELIGKCWIPVFNILKKSCSVTLAHPQYTKSQKGNKTDRKDAK